jgi:hypothetical protein
MSLIGRGDERGFFTGGKYFTSKSFTLWLFVFGIVCLLMSLAYLYLEFRPPYLSYFIEWLQNQNMYLYLTAFFLLAGAVSFVTAIVYAKHVKNRCTQTKDGG